MENVRTGSLGAARNMCDQCEGTGWVQVNRGQAIFARRCQCQAKARPHVESAKLGLPPRLARISFETLEYPSHEKEKSRFNHLHRRVRQVRAFADGFPAGPKTGLLLYGNDTQNASLLGVATIRALADKGLRCLYFDHRSLLQILQGRMSSDERTAEAGHRAARAVMRADMLMIDSLGELQRITDWASDTVAAVIKYRYDHSKGLVLATPLRIGSDDPSNQALPGNQGMLNAGGVHGSLTGQFGWQTFERLTEMCHLVEVRQEQTQPKTNSGR